MKKLILCLAAAVVSLTAAADEGMWLLPYLQKMNIGDMKAKGCQLTAEDIYSVNHGSLKDAIVIFGNGCTGEVVSPEGLVFTNHHCGYGSIQALSSVEHDYLKDGFWAMSNEEELPAPGLTVTFIRRIIDVTPEVLGNIPSIAKGEERSEMEDKNIEALYEKLRAENPGMTINIQPFFGGNQYFAFVMEVYRDIRLVGTPRRRSASSAAKPTTGCGRVIRATSRSSASMPARTTVRRNIRKRTYPTRPKSSSRCRSPVTRPTISR